MNPKLWLYYFATEQSPPGLPIQRIVLKLEDRITCFALIYITGEGNPIQIELQPEEFCGLAGIYLAMPFLIGTERTSIYNGETHQKVLSMTLSLPECLASIDYEDYPIRLNFSEKVESFLRNKCLEVTFEDNKN